MTLTTDLITYNVNERGRKARGRDRNFDTAALAALINGPAVQEKVRHGDMFGYFGHWPRIKFGMEPAEGGVIDGKAISVPAALRTIELSADADGTIRHRAEFLDTNEGRIAARMYQSKAGGFSSAIDTVPRTAPSLPAGFYGFDYVLEPNYSTNRGHKVMLDSAAADGEGEGYAGELMAILDAAMGESTQAASILNTLFDSLHAQHLVALETVQRLAQENDELIARLARARGGQPVLDSAALEDARMAPVRGSLPPDFEQFRRVELARLQDLPRPREYSPDVGYAERRFGVKL